MLIYMHLDERQLLFLYDTNGFPEDLHYEPEASIHSLEAVIHPLQQDTVHLIQEFPFPVKYK